MHQKPTTPRKTRHQTTASAPEVRLLERLQRRDPNAWTLLIDTWSTRLYSYLLYNTHCDSDAQALLQEIFAIIMQIILQTTTYIHNLSVLIATTAYQAVVRYHQQRGRPPLDRLTYLAQSTDPEQAQRFIRRFIRLTPELQQILLLRYHSDLTLTELAQVFGKSILELQNLLTRMGNYLAQDAAGSVQF